MSDRELEASNRPDLKRRGGQLFSALRAENCFGKHSALCRGFLGFYLQRPELNCGLGHKKMNVVVSKSPADVWEITELQYGYMFTVTGELSIRRQSVRFMPTKTSSTNVLESKNFFSISAEFFLQEQNSHSQIFYGWGSFVCKWKCSCVFSANNL